LPARQLSLVLALAAVKGALLIALIPPFQTPDEYAHYDYVLYLSRVSPAGFVAGRGLVGATLEPTEYATREVGCLAAATGAGAHFDDASPVRAVPWREAIANAAPCGGLDTASSLEQGGRLNTIFNYPPLYYAAVSLVVRAARAAGLNPLLAYYLARALSILLLCAAVALTAVLGARLGVGAAVTFAAALVVALHPQLSMLSVAVQPDMLGLVLVTLGLAGLVAAIARPQPRHAAWVGLVIGLLLLTKLHLALPLLGAGAALAAVAAMRGHARQALGAAAVGAGVAAGVGGWWYARSWVLFGNVLGFVETGRDTGASASFLLNLRHFVELRGADLLRSYWGVWGWLDYGLPHGLLPWLGLLSVAPAVLLLAGAHAVYWAPRSGGEGPAPDRLNVPGLLVVGLAFAGFAAQMVAITGLLGSVNDQGRHWLGYVAVHALYFAAPLLLLTPPGLDAAARWASSRAGFTRALAAVLLVVTACLALASLATRVPLAHLEITMRSSVDGAADMFVDSGAGFSDVERERRAVRARDGWITHSFPLRARQIEHLRFDPMLGSGQVEVSRVALRERSGAIREFPLASLTPVHDLEAPEPTASGLLLRAQAGAADPQVMIALDDALVLGAAAPFRWLDTPRAWLLRAYRRLPFLQGLVPLWPWAAFGVLLVVAARRLPRRAPWTSRDAARWQAAFTAALAGVLLALNVWLMALTWSYYRG
jgi:hypothetical protein